MASGRGRVDQGLLGEGKLGNHNLGAKCGEIVGACDGAVGRNVGWWAMG